MKIIFNADDFGITEENSQNISDCFKYGLDSCSIIVNSDYINHQIIKEKIINKNKNTKLHLNLIEGNSLFKNQEDINLLTNKSNLFDNSFFKLCLIYYCGPRYKKSLIKKQIEEAIEKQIIKYLDITKKNNYISIDSHQHIHLIPFIFDIIIDLSKKYKIEYIRTTNEYISFNFNLKIFLNNINNLTKVIILNFFSYIAKKKLNNIQIETSDNFLGVLNTGEMNSEIIKKYLRKNKNKIKNIEILMHPGHTKKEDKNNFINSSKFYRYYSSNNRIMEKNCFTKGEINKIKNFYAK